MRKRLPLFGLLMILLISASCTEESGPDKPEPRDPPLYGALVTPRGDLDVDPYLVDAYQALGVDGYQIGHLALSWSAIEVGPSRRNWLVFDRHVQQSIRRGIGLSVVVEFVHGADGDVPPWIWTDFPGWEDPALATKLNSFLREVGERAQGTIRYLWLGEGIDRFAAAYPGDEPLIIAFYAELADSAREIFPEARIGTMITPALLEATGGEPLVRQILAHLDLIGLSVPPEPAAGAVPAPAVAFETLKERIAPWQDAPFAILETGYPSGDDLLSSVVNQKVFVSTIAGWLWNKPALLELFCWSPIHDAGSSLADSLAARRYRTQVPARATMVSLLRSSALRRLDGSPKAGRQVWVEDRP